MHISCFTFLLITLLAVCFICIFLFVCFICILNDARQKANLNSCSSSKGVIKPQRQLTSSTMHPTQELFINVQCGGSPGSAKDRAAGHGADSDQLGAGVRADPLTVPREGARELSANHATVL